MISKNISILILSALLAVACSPPSVVEEISAPVVEEVADPVAEVEVEESAENTTAGESQTVSFSADIWPTIEQYALDAHGGKGGVFLESYDDILGYVEPGNPEESVLYKRLTGDGVPVMPPSGQLPDDIVQLFYDWIAQGAKDN